MDVDFCIIILLVLMRSRFKRSRLMGRRRHKRTRSDPKSCQLDTAPQYTDCFRQWISEDSRVQSRNPG